MSISFKKVEAKTRILSPFKGFSMDEIPLEIRFDPLTGQSGRVFDLPFKPERPDPSDIVRRSKEIFCPFCPESLEKSTPLFPKDVISEGRIVVGEATLIPNLLPFDKYAGVSIFSHQHYVSMNELVPETMQDAFAAALIFVKRIAELDSQVNYFSINWNYMPPAGSSIVHPHLQPNCGEVPTNEQRLQMEGCTRYYEDTGNSFWQDFMDAEKEDGNRYIGEIGNTFWTMSYLPMGFLPDVYCIFSGHDSLLDLGAKDLGPFLEGLSLVLKYFDLNDILSFNVVIFSVRKDQHFRVNARICPRLFPRPIGNSDMAYLQAIHREPFTVRPPEAVCQQVKDVFKGSVRH